MSEFPAWAELPKWTCLFEAFRSNPAIDSIASIPRWSISNQHKVPMNMHRYEFEFETDRGASPYVPDTMRTLDEMRILIPNAKNYCFLLDPEDSPLCIDIEPTCSDLLKASLSKLPALYRETSRSGNGIHLLLPNGTDANLIDEFPNAASKTKLQASDRSHEILRAHWVTFTMNQIAAPTPTDADFNVLLKPLYSQATPPKASVDILCAEDIDISDIPDGDTILRILDDGSPYRKSPGDFSNDMSRYERGLMCFIAKQMLDIMAIDRIQRNGHEYTEAERIALLHRAATSRLDHREKHETSRHGMPYLAYESASVLAMIEAERKEAR